MKKPVYILDAYGLIYRSYFAFIGKPLTNKEGRNVSAIYGFFRNLHGIFAHHSPECFIAAFDSRTPTFRHEIYPEYKATRAKTPEDLHAQIPIIEEILTALGISIIRQDGFEADDIIASVAALCKKEDRPCVVISGDKDLMQLVGNGTTILKPGKTGGWVPLDSDGVAAEWGVGPELMLDLLSMTGDASDNVPGIKGVGDKTALKLLAQYGSLDGIYAHQDEIPGALGTKIRENRDMAYFSKKLIALCEDVPFDRELDHYGCSSLDMIAVSRLLMREDLPSLAKLWGGVDADKQEAGIGNTVEAQKKTTQKSAYSGGDAVHLPPLSNDLPQIGLKKNSGTYSAVTDPHELARLIDDAIASGRAAFDTETTGLQIMEDRLVGFSLSFKAGEGYYVPILAPAPELGEEPSKTMSIAEAAPLIRKLFETAGFHLILHNAKFDLQILSRANIISSIISFIHDTMIVAWLLDPDWSSFALESLASNQLGLETIAYADVVPKGKTFADVPIQQAVCYAAEDSDLTLQLWEKLYPRLENTKLLDLYKNIETPLIPILARMELEGIRLERGPLAEFSQELEGKIKEVEKSIHLTAGREFNIASPKQLQEILFVERKLTPGKKTKTGYSTDTSVLEDLAAEDILPAMILDYRGLAKLKSTYVDALPDLADSQGRLHTTFIQSGTATGRLSSRDPNLQNIPIRDDNGRRIRAAFRSENGKVLVSADYAQIELVILAHLSRDKNLGDAFKSGVDVHKRTASLIFGVDADQVTQDMRRVAKTINFGVMYGMSAFRLSNELRIPRGDAAGFINTYFATYSGVAEFMNETKEKARSLGYVETIMGRRRYIRGIDSSNKIERSGAERIAVNTPIQGSAADIVKAAMIRVDRALTAQKLSTRLLLQVHDELIMEGPEHEEPLVKDLLRKEMESVVTLEVPLKVSVESGKSWGDFH
ncbi:MAG: DNA polymerase I [Spirochaetales bacterium]|nr:DNA polymerase I [Spirochaetales bacterium]